VISISPTGSKAEDRCLVATGVFRISCELTLQLLQDNKDSLMSVLDAFIHDPLVEWEEEKNRLERAAEKGKGANPPVANPSKHQGKGKEEKTKYDDEFKLQLARSSLNAIERKLKGLYTKGSHRNAISTEAWSTSNLVELLIQESMDLANLVGFAFLSLSSVLQTDGCCSRQECILVGQVGINIV
jgi:serine/threonine-protein kinase ATR